MEWVWGELLQDLLVAVLGIMGSYLSLLNLVSETGPEYDVVGSPPRKVLALFLKLHWYFENHF